MFFAGQTSTGQITIIMCMCLSVGVCVCVYVCGDEVTSTLW